MSVPKAAVNENDQICVREVEVRFANQAGRVAPTYRPEGPQVGGKCFFWFCVLPLYGLHDLPALSSCENVDHRVQLPLE